MKVSELRTKSENELKETLNKLHKDLKNAAVEFVQRKEKNIKKPRMLRKDIAKVLTLINEKKILVEKESK
jgi:ribosomal protein L29